jgi:TatD DNase family protein
MLIDSHAHLEMPEFEKDLEEVIHRAKDRDVNCIFTVGTEQGGWKIAVDIARTHPNVYAILGVHPHNAREIKHQTYSMLRELCREEKVRALGEIGLDFFRNVSPREIQLRRFREQIGLARELGLPLVVHDREAHRETLEVLRSENAGTCGGVLHCFSGDYDMARKCLDMGLHISVAGSITFRNAEEVRGVIRKLPLDGVLVETDAPFLAPVPFRGKRNEPGYVRYSVEKIAEIKNIPFEKVAEVTTENAFRVFRLKAG